MKNNKQVAMINTIPLIRYYTKAVSVIFSFIPSKHTKALRPLSTEHLWLRHTVSTGNFNLFPQTRGQTRQQTRTQREF